jgi:hypothetical protein
MKNSVLFSVLLLVISVISTINAKAQTYQVGTNVVSFGVGLGSSIAGYTYGSQTPGISLQYERGVWEAGPGVISLGGYIGFKGYKYSYTSPGESYTEKWNYTIVGARGAYHFTGLDVENLDVYGGLMLAYDDLNYSSSGSGGFSSTNYGSDLSLTAFVGAKYFFAGDLGAFAELGYGVAFLNVGLSYKF